MDDIPHNQIYRELNQLLPKTGTNNEGYPKRPIQYGTAEPEYNTPTVSTIPVIVIEN
jgi:hypothetical protein